MNTSRTVFTAVVVALAFSAAPSGAQTLTRARDWVDLVPTIMDYSGSRRVLIESVALRGQIPGLGNLFACLHNARSSEGANLSQQLNMWRNGPGGYVRWLVERETQKVTDNYAQLMASELNALKNRSPAPTEAQLRTRAIEQFKLFGARNVAARCTVQYFDNQNIIQGTRANTERVTQALRAHAEEVWNTHMRPAIDSAVVPALRVAIGNQLKELATCEKSTCYLLDEEQVKRVANGMYTELMVAQMNQAAADLNALQGATGAAQAQALSDLQAVLAPPAPETIRQKFIVEVIREMGHKYVDNSSAPELATAWPGGGSHWVGVARSHVLMGEDLLGNVVEGLCGLIPEAGAAVCAVIKTIAEASFHYLIVPELERRAVAALHNKVDEAADDVWSAMQSPQSQAALAGFGNSRPVAQFIVQFSLDALITANLEDYLEDIHDALEGYNASVASLAQQAVSVGN